MAGQASRACITAHAHAPTPAAGLADSADGMDRWLCCLNAAVATTRMAARASRRSAAAACSPSVSLSPFAASRTRSRYDSNASSCRQSVGMETENGRSSYDTRGEHSSVVLQRENVAHGCKHSPSCALDSTTRLRCRHRLLRLRSSTHRLQLLFLRCFGLLCCIGGRLPVEIQEGPAVADSMHDALSM